MPQKTYQAFGLHIQSDILLSALEEIECDLSDVDIFFLREGGITRQTHLADPEIDVRADAQYFHWKAVGAFLIRDAKTVLIQPHEDISDHLVSQPLLGLVMSVLLEQRGLLSLHASAVSYSGQNFLFIGDKGAGKSTTAMSLIAAGAIPLSDDLVPVEVSSFGQPHLHPSFPTTKLFPDSEKALQFQSGVSGKQVHPHSTKRQLQLGRQPMNGPQKIDRIFVLERSQNTTKLSASILPAHQAFDAIRHNCFLSRCGEQQLGQAHQIAHLRRCGALIANVPIMTMHIPEDLDRLHEIPEFMSQLLAG